MKKLMLAAFMVVSVSTFSQITDETTSVKNEVVKTQCTVSYTHLTLPTNREV